MSSGRALLGGVAGVGVGVGALPWLADSPNGSDTVLLPAPIAEAPNELPPKSEAKGSALAGKAATGLAAGRLAAAGAAPNRSMPAADGAGAAPNGSAPNASRAAAAGGSLEVEKVDQTSAAGEPEDTTTCLIVHSVFATVTADVTVMLSLYCQLCMLLIHYHY